MVTAQDLLDSSTRADLIDQAKDLGLDVKDAEGKPLNKPELAEAILAAEEAEIAADEAEAEAELDDDTTEEDTDAGEAYEPDVAEVQDEPEPTPVEEEVSDEDVLVRFIGANPLLQVVGLSFKKSSPFKVLPAGKAEQLFDSRHGHKFRVATPKEAKEFYS